MANHDRITAGGTATRDPESARAEIAMTRARMSETIDEIEDVLLRRKEEIQERLDVFAPIRERPLQALGAVFAAGVVIGLLTGGDDEDRLEVDFSERDARLQAAEARAERWERRARRILELAREQEGAQQDYYARRHLVASGVNGDGADHEPLDGLRDAVADRFGGLLSGALRQMFSPGASRPS